MDFQKELSSETEYSEDNNYKIVLLKGNVQSTKPVEDPHAVCDRKGPFNCMLLSREVEFFQPTGSKYMGGWRSVAANRSSGNSNLFLASAAFRSPTSLGSFWLSNDIIDQIGAKSNKTVPKLPNRIRFPKVETSFFLKPDGWYYWEQNKGTTDTPSFGDFRLRYTCVEGNRDLTLIGIQVKNTIQYAALPFDSLMFGLHSMDSFINTATSKYSVYQWIGLGMMTLGSWKVGYTPKIGSKWVATVAGTAWFGTRLLNAIKLGRILVPAGLAGGSEYIYQIQKPQKRES